MNIYILMKKNGSITCYQDINVLSKYVSLEDCQGSFIVDSRDKIYYLMPKLKPQENHEKGITNKIFNEIAHCLFPLPRYEICAIEFPFKTRIPFDVFARKFMLNLGINHQPFNSLSKLEIIEILKGKCICE